MIATDDHHDLVCAALQGDPKAFEELVSEHQRMIYSLCYRMSGSVDDAQDLMQETFIQAYRHLSEFRADARFSSWIYRIAANLCLNALKRRERRERLQREWGEQQQDHPGRPEGLGERVQEALMKLNPEQRAAMVLTVYDGLSHAEAARVLGCSETTVSWRLFMARRKLKVLLRDQAEEPR